MLAGLMRFIQATRHCHKTGKTRSRQVAIRVLTIYYNQWRNIHVNRTGPANMVLMRVSVTTLFIIISALHASGGFSAHNQELIKLYVQPWLLSCFPTVYRWCEWVGSNPPTQAVDSMKA